MKRLVLFAPFYCFLEGGLEDYLKSWAQEHGYEFDSFQDKRLAMQRVASLGAGSIFVGALWDFSIDGNWSEESLPSQTISQIEEVLPADAAVLLINTITLSDPLRTYELIERSPKVIRLLETCSRIVEELDEIVHRLSVLP